MSGDVRTILQGAARAIRALPIEHNEPGWRCDGCRAHILANDVLALIHDWEHRDDDMDAPAAVPGGEDGGAETEQP